MKWIIVMCCALLWGCTEPNEQDYTGQKVELAKKLCEPHGGLRQLYLSSYKRQGTVLVYGSVYCMNGLNITIEYPRPLVPY